GVGGDADGRGQGAHPGGAHVRLEHAEDVGGAQSDRLCARTTLDELRHDVRGCRTDRAGVAGEARGADATIIERELHAHAVAAERIDVLRDRSRTGQLAAESRTPPALADRLAVEDGARHRDHSSSPRTAPARYGGNLYAIPRDSKPPWPNPAISALPIASPASRRGSTRSNVVAWENIPHVGMPRTGRSFQRARNSRLPGCAGAP